MKLLGWMHRKFRQNNGDAVRDLATVSPCLNCLSGWPSPDDRLHNQPAAIIRQELLPAETEPPALMASILFDGLLNIGTFGSPVILETVAPATEEEETLTPVVNETAEKEAEMITESELMAITVELEKVLAAESEKEKGVGSRLSLGSARASHAGASGKGLEVFPLQDFLFGSPVEVAETTEVAERRRERRASLGELFMRNRASEEAGGDWKREELTPEDHGISRPALAEEMSVGMKRMLKYRGSIGGGGDGDGAAGKCRGAETKIQNILRIFNRKIHPENSIASRKFTKRAKYEINKSSRNSMNDYGGQVLSPKEADNKESFSSFKSQSYQESRSLVKNNSTGNREQWIKTDADYLVLEL